MSHELRTPLNSILGFSNLLRRGEDISAAQRKDLDTINRSGEHLLGLINDVLDVAKIEAGRVTLESAPCDLRALVRVVVDMMQVRAAAKDLQLIVEESGGFPRFIRVDASKMREILINLIINAIKFTQRGSVVLRLAAAPEDASNRVRLRLEVEDTGIGIAPEDQAGIFEAFSQVGAALRKGTGHGTGLGLTIVKQYVELMGGSIRLQSVLGQGSRFCVELPVALATESEVTPPRDERRVIRIEAGQQEYRILVVEDDMESRQLLQRLLEDAGFAVRVAENGAEGVAVFPSWMPHFIWMDRRMPEMDGLEATGRIRKLEGGQEVVIAVTASVLDSQLNDVLSAGMDDFLRKPYRPAEIFDCMARHLGLRYVYADDAPRPGTQDSLPLRPEALAALSEELRGELANALMSLDADRIARVIRGISEVDPALGAVVAQFADRLAYTPILRALRAGTGKVEFAEGDS
ncbi:MAG: ATP-binding protein [Candidatus Solibacter sp.]|nr:ATP-binding protein [Candidatus Solibacter sp.]